jgi:hypothetical protein
MYPIGRNDYKESAEHNPKGPEKGKARMIHGGNWFDLDDDLYGAI